MSQTACTKKQDEPDDAVIVDNDTDAEATDKSETDKAQKEEQSEDKTQTSEPENDKTGEDDKTVIPDNSEKEDMTEKTEQTPTQTPEKEPDSSTEQTPEKKPDAQTENKSEENPEEQSKEEPVIYDDSNATPASSFEYKIYEVDNYVYLKKFIGNEKDIVIPNYIEGYPVKYIGLNCFMSTQIESVVISENIELIYDKAFQNCVNLKTVVTKSKNVVIGSSAFRYCSSLTDLTLGEGVVEIGSGAFTLCPSLKTIHIPSTLNKFGREAFAGLAIEKLTFADGIETVGGFSCFVPNFFTKLPENCFKSVTIPASVKKLYIYSFGENLQEMTLLGNAPELIKIYGENYLSENLIIKYKKGTTGWDDPKWKEFTLVEIE